MTETDVVDYLLNKDTFIEISYDLYQLQHRNYEDFKRVINKEYIDISKQKQTTL